MCPCGDKVRTSMDPVVRTLEARVIEPMWSWSPADSICGGLPGRLRPGVWIGAGPPVREPGCDRAVSVFPRRRVNCESGAVGEATVYVA